MTSLQIGKWQPVKTTSEFRGFVGRALQSASSQLYVFNQGAWEMEGDMLKGKFSRKDNSKVLTTTRTLVGGELVQVSVRRCVSSISAQRDMLLLQFCPNKCVYNPSTTLSFSCRLTTMKGWMQRGSSRSSNLNSRVYIFIFI